MKNNHKLAVIITLLCLSIHQIYLYFGGSSFGRGTLRGLMDYLLPSEDDYIKAGGLILLVFAVPLLVAGTACTLLLSSPRADGRKIGQEEELYEISPRSVMKNSQDSASASFNGNFASNNECSQLLQSTAKPKSRTYRAILHTISNPRRFAIIFVLVPCLFFYICNISRHFKLYTSAQTNNTGTDHPELDTNYSVLNLQFRQLLQHIANDSAIMALVAMAHLLVPVSKHSPLIILSEWSPVEAVVIHRLTGRLAIFGITTHGGLHLICGYWRWWNAFTRKDEYKQSRTFLSGFVPPWSCWTGTVLGTAMEKDQQLDFGYGCYNETSPCECYDFFLNLTGLLGMIALIVLGCSSVRYIRRKHYWLFYLLHVTSGPCFVIMTLLHYNKAILYLCPGLLYYASTTIPTYTQNWMQRGGGNRILSVTKIPCPASQQARAVWDIVFECFPESFAQYQPGQNCILHVPQISAVTHPFTVNKVPGFKDRLRLLIRETGPFTIQLGKCCERIASNTKNELESQSPHVSSTPPFYISGFYGVTNRLAKLQSHDQVIIIAGGIGITPYLSLLLDVVNPHSPPASDILKTLELHWICRDISLIRFIQDQYFSEMLNCSTVDGITRPHVKITVHFTGNTNQMQPFFTGLDAPHINLEAETSSDPRATTHPMKHGFQATRFVTFFAIFSIGIWLVWFIFSKVQSQDEIAPRILPVFFIAISSFSLSLGFAHLTSSKQQRESMSPLRKQLNYSATSDCSYFHTCHLSVEQKNKGRPDLLSLISSIQDATYPGVFVCGPNQLLANVRQATANCMLSPTSVYEELFET